MILYIESWQGTAPDFSPAAEPERPAEAEEEGPEMEVLRALERGELNVEEALRKLGG